MISRWMNVDSIEYFVASIYAKGKGYFFELFFGWRQTRYDQARFMFSRKDWEYIDGLINYYKKFVKGA